MNNDILFGFLTDDALINTTSLDLTDSSDQGYGVLQGECVNYFVNKGVLGDMRLKRLAVLNSKSPYGNLRFHFDQNRFNLDLLKALKSEEQIHLFNIIERVYLQQEYTDANIEHQLLNASEYIGYVPGSFVHSAEVSGTAVRVFDIDKQYKDTSFAAWYSFDFETPNVKFKVHFWVARKVFETEYPYTTITSVIPPYEPTILTNPSELVQSGGLAVLQAGATYIFENANIETVARDQNGIYTYKTKYVLDGSTTLSMPFALPYCGPNVPSSLDCRKAIKEYLEEHTILTEEQLEQLFPELYVNSRFLLVPLWDVFTERVDREIYNSILSLQTAYTKMKLLFSEMDPTWVEDYTEIFLNSYNTMFTLTVPDELNDDNFSIRKLHPTYQNYASHNPGYKWMEVATQEFAGMITRCFAVLQGEGVASEFISTELNGKIWLSFVSGKSEFLVMTKDSYMEFINNTNTANTI